MQASMSITMHDTIIFDFDGTLIDSAPGILATYSAVLNAAGIKPVVPLTAHLIGPPMLQTMATVTGDISQEARELLIKEFKRRHTDIAVAHTPAYPAATQTLQTLMDAGKKIYLATNKRAEPTLALIEKFGWQRYFRRIYCIDSQQPAFSDKTAMLRQLLSENALSAETCIYIGDTRGDYLSATACGMKFIAALWGYENWDAYPDRTSMLRHACTSLSELSAV